MAIPSSAVDTDPTPSFDRRSEPDPLQENPGTIDHHQPRYPHLPNGYESVF
jgi:hypothetical protein